MAVKSRKELAKPRVRTSCAVLNRPSPSPSEGQSAAGKHTTWRCSAQTALIDLVNQTAARFFRPRPRAVEHCIGKDCLIEHLLMDFVTRIGDDAQRSQDVGYDFVVGECASLGQAARNSGVQKSGFERTADFVGAIE